jgi:hypothetical protein
MEKLISMNEHCWHYKLVKFVWGFDPKEFKNLCPYFWLTIASIFAFPVVLLWTGVKYVFSKLFDGIIFISDKIATKVEDNHYTKVISNLTKSDVYYLKHRRDNNYQIYAATEFRHFKLLDKFLDKHPKMFDDLFLRSDMDEEEVDKWEDDFTSELSRMFDVRTRKRQKAIENDRKQDEFNRSMKAKMNKIAEVTRSIFTFIYALMLSFAVFFATTALTDFVIWFSHQMYILDWPHFWATVWHVAKIFVVVCSVIIAISAFLVYGVEWKDVENKKWWMWLLLIFWYPLYFVIGIAICKWIVYYFLYKLIIYTILWGILRGIGVGFQEFGGIFADYFNASYSDYCPGINWED